MLDNFLTEEEETQSNQNVVLPLIVENTMGEHESNEEVLRRIRTSRKLLLIIRKKQLKCMGDIIKRQGI